jgi:hypothetical protein
MAKEHSKKSGATGGAKKPAGKGPAKKKAGPGVSGPSIDPNVVSAAASMVANKLSSGGSSAAGAQSSGAESSSFRQMKQALNKPHSQIIGGLLDKSGAGSQKKSAVPFGGGQQVGHNQTIGSDASRKNVPRRTGG